MPPEITDEQLLAYLTGENADPPFDPEDPALRRRIDELRTFLKELDQAGNEEKEKLAYELGEIARERIRREIGSVEPERIQTPRRKKILWWPSVVSGAAAASILFAVFFLSFPLFLETDPRSTPATPPPASPTPSEPGPSPAPLLPVPPKTSHFVRDTPTPREFERAFSVLSADLAELIESVPRKPIDLSPHSGDRSDWSNALYRTTETLNRLLLQLEEQQRQLQTEKIPPKSHRP